MVNQARQTVGIPAKPAVLSILPCWRKIQMQCLETKRSVLTRTFRRIAVIAALSLSCCSRKEEVGPPQKSAAEIHYDELHDTAMQSFRPPAIGSSVIILTKNECSYTGILKELDDRAAVVDFDGSQRRYSRDFYHVKRRKYSLLMSMPKRQSATPWLPNLNRCV